MNIGFLTPEYATTAKPDGGLANYLRKTSQALAARGHHVTVFVSDLEDSAWLDGQVQVYEIAQRSLFKGFPGSRRLKPVINYYQQILSAQRLADKAWNLHKINSFDVLQASSYCSPGYALRHNRRVPLICRVSSYAPLIRAAFGRRSSLGDRWLDRLEKRQVLDADACFTPSQFMSETYARFVGRRPDVLRTPLDETRVSPDPSYYQAHFSGVSYLIFFGTLSRMKGVDLLAEALPPVLKKYPQLTIVFVGRDDGLPDGSKAFDMVLSRCHADAGRLFYHPALPKEQLFPLIEHSLGVLMPSRIDNYPNAALEALSLGVPLIGSDGSSLEEIITEGETGFLARNGDPQSLCAAIQRLVELDPARLQKMREDCLKVAGAMRREDRLSQLVAYYESVIQRFRENQH